MPCEDHGIDIPTEKIHIIRGIDKNGDRVIATRFEVSGTATDDGECDLIEMITALGMLEYGKHQLMERYKSDDDDDD